jgi:hypothetical protein
MRRAKKAEARPDEDEISGLRPATQATHSWAAHDTPSTGEILVMDAQQPDKLRSLAQEPWNVG